ncbi:unnamed protein product [Oreochromis niloticus]|nr:unnamed protein product [Mustela putorius furo]
MSWPCASPASPVWLQVFLSLLSLLSSLSCSAHHRGGVLCELPPLAPAPANNLHSGSGLKEVAGGASSLDYCVTLTSRQPEDRHLVSFSRSTS